jgi:ABC-type antimicrobial peptide transport system permease subunit
VSQVLRTAAYRFRATFRSQRGGYLTIIVLMGLVGGLAMGAVAAARRTQASYTVYLASIHPAELGGATGVLNPATGTGGYNARVVREIERLPHVTSVEVSAGLDIIPLTDKGVPIGPPAFDPPAAGNGYGSLGLYFDQDRASVISGTMANPRDADEFMLDPQSAASLHIHVGETVPIGIYTNRQTLFPKFGTVAVKPYRVVVAKMVGIADIGPSVLEDQTDQSDDINILFTPALTRQLLSCCVNYSEAGVQVDHPRNVALVGREILQALPAGFPPFASPTSSQGKAERALRPVSIALGVFGGIAGLATLLIAGQLIARRLRSDAEERVVLRALGAGPATVTIDGLLGIASAVIAGSVLAAVVAIGLSPLAPLGPVRPVYPDLGVSFDWTVLGLGLAILLVGLSLIALGLGYLGAPHRLGARRAARPERRSLAVSSAASAGLPPTAVAGLRFALEPGSGRSAAPVRSAILGAATAVAVLVTTVTFGASLNALVAQPKLYGWNWNAALISGGDIPQAQVIALLRQDRDVAAFSGVYLPSVTIDGQNIAVMGEPVGSAVGPPTLSGNPLTKANQVLLGPDTLAQLHKRVGQTVVLSTGATAAKTLTIVGTVAMPAMGSIDGGVHLEMGSGALLSSTLIPRAVSNPFGNPIPGPNAVLIRFKRGIDRRAAFDRLNRIGAATTNTANFGVMAVSVLRPAEILSYGSLGDTPAYLGAGLAAGAFVALGLTLISSVRRRRGDLAVLKTLGFTGRQLAAAVMWQSSISVLLGSLIGVPVGIVLGRWLWDLFARDISAVPVPSVPVLSVVLIALGGLLLANIVAAIPGRIAARTPTAVLLRSE